MISESAEASAIHGWGCTPTGDPPAAAVGSDTTRPQPFLKGWKKITLYSILIFLMSIIFLNLALTLWIISALKLSMNGIGPIKIINGGIQLDEQSWFLDKLVASTITSQPGRPITLYSYRNFTVRVAEPNQGDLSQLFINKDGFRCSGRKFEVRDNRDSKVFSASKEEVRVYADTLALDGNGGLTVKGAVETSVVQAPPGSDLQLESLTRRLEITAPQSISLESRAGSIEISSHNNLELASTAGSIKLNAQNIEIKDLKVANVTDKPQKYIKSKVYQLCACGSGKLFLAAPEAICASYGGDLDVCR